MAQVLEIKSYVDCPLLGYRICVQEDCVGCDCLLSRGFDEIECTFEKAVE